MPSITSSIETMLGTGHRLANSAVAPSLPDKPRGVVGRVAGGDMWQQLEQCKRRTGFELHPVEIEIIGGGGISLQEKRNSTVNGSKIGVDGDSEISEADVVGEHDEYGCDVSKDSNEGGGNTMIGVTQAKKMIGRGRGRPRFRGSMA